MRGDLIKTLSACSAFSAPAAEWSFMSETSVAQLDLESANVHYELFVAGRWMNSSVEPAKH